MRALSGNSNARLERNGSVRLWRPRAVGLAVLSTGVVCQCHVLVGLAGLIMGGQVLSPAAQDGVHAVYVPVAVLVGALLLGKETLEGRKSRSGTSEVQGE